MAFLGCLGDAGGLVLVKEEGGLFSLVGLEE